MLQQREREREALVCRRNEWLGLKASIYIYIYVQSGENGYVSYVGSYYVEQLKGSAGGSGR